MKPNVESPPEKNNEIRKVRRYALIGAVLWTLLQFGLFVASFVDHRVAENKIGRSMAVASIEKDVVTLSLDLIQKAKNSELQQEAYIHSFIWLLGLGYIWFGTRKNVGSMALLLKKRNRLYESEERYRALFTRAADGIFILSTAGRLIEVNESLARMHGYSPQEMQGMELKDLDTPESFCLAPERLRRILTGEALTFEVEHYHKDGHIFPIEVSASLLSFGGESYIQCFQRDITERKQAEEEIERNDSRLRRLVSILQHPSETIQEFLDYALEQALQLSESKIGYIYHYHEGREEFVLNTWSKEVMPQCAVAGSQNCYKLDKTGIWGEAVRQRRPIIVNDFQASQPLKKGCPEGHVQLLKFMTIPIFNGDSIVGVIGLANKKTDYKESDILQVSLLMEAVWKVTERKRAEVEMCEAKDKFKAIANYSASWEGWFSTEGKLLWMNQYSKDLTGYTPEEYIAAEDFLSMVIIEADIARVSEKFQEAMQGNHSDNQEIRFLRKDGSMFWGSVSWRPILDTNGCSLGFRTSTQDITKRKQAEVALRESEKSFRLIAENITEVFWIADIHISTILYISPGYERVWGRSTASLYENPRSFIDAIHVEDRERVFNDLVVQKGSQPFDHEYRIVRPDGEIRWIWDRGYPVREETGQVNKYVGIAQDITERKRAEEEILTANGLLNVARTQAESANRAKSVFLANMSHEIRTPMNGVIGMTQLLEMTDLTVVQQEYVAAIEESGNNLLSLINDILDLSKIDAGKVKIELAEFNIQSCINDIILTQRPAIFAKRITLDADVAGDIPQVLMGDQLRIKQIILNLLGNAVKFTLRGGITISAQVLEQQNTSVLVQISVRDTGIGISADALDKIFMPFVQEDGSTTRQFGGTGLGLTISRQLVELMQGSISVESTPGAGSCFTVTLPFSFVQKSEAADVAPPKTMLCWDGPPLRILFAEDNTINIKFGMSLLKILGHDVVLAENGSDCLAALERGTFDLVLMDIQMPVMSGSDALCEIRRKELGAAFRQPVIALTAYALRGEKEHLLEEGFDGYISKPLDIRELMSEMKRVMGMTGETVKDTAENCYEEKTQAVNSAVDLDRYSLG